MEGKPNVKVAPEDMLFSVLPDADSLFTVSQASLDEVLQKADIVLDTNVLLLPYRAGKDSLDRIAAVFRSLAKKDRLFVPGQVAREYARNRPKVLSDLIQKLADQKSRVAAPPTLDFPLLEKLPEYQALKGADAELKQGVAKYATAVEGILGAVQSWGAADPVQQQYQAIFQAKQIADPKFDLDEVRATFRKRVEQLIPPGYKDASKEDGGIGDYLIWLTILAIGEEHKRDLVFVSGEEKADWLHRANNRPLMPRAELVDEFRRRSSGCVFYLINLSTLLEILAKSISSDTLARVKAEERRVRERVLEELTCPFCASSVTWSIFTGPGETATPHCPACKRSFHAHRTSSGIIVRTPRSRTRAADTMRTWFLERYKDPADGVPYDGREGGYQYVNGGPFHPREILQEQFGDQFSAKLIESVADDLVSQSGDEWVRVEDY